ncbi:MAG TPA: TolC family protein [Planctomycetaceae bacterium]|nr:TolC family protein [Planctomycetaceae bacterium]
MPRIASPQTPTAARGARRTARRVCALIPVLLIAGCASLRPDLPVPPELSQAGVSARVLIPPDLNVNPAETVVKPEAQSQAPANPLLPPELGGAPTRFALSDAIAFALQNSPRLRSARAEIQRAKGQERVAFAPFLPQIDLLGQYGVVSSTLAPGIPGNEGFLLPNGTGTRDYAQTEVGLEWTLYDFGRTCGHYLQSVARERITELQLVRANQTVEFDVANAYLEVLLARASRRVQEDAVRRAEAILEDTVARRKQGVALKDDVLRAEVQLSESREALVLAREGELNAVARLNNVMGRNAGWPLEVVDMESQPPIPGRLADLLDIAAGLRPEVALARQAVMAAQEGREAAKGEFLPRIFARAAAGHTDGENVITGWQEGVGLHIDVPLYAGGRHRGELRSADADIEAALADAQTILDAISLQVNLAYRAIMANQERVGLARPAVEQSAEALRIVRQRYRAGTATPTDVIEAETAATRAEQRYVSARIEYLSALARLAYVMSDDPERRLSPLPDRPSEELPPMPPSIPARPTP